MRATLPISVTVAEDGGASLPAMTNTGAKTDGVELRLMKLAGWDDTVDLRTNPENVPAGDGVYDDGPLLGPRTVIAEGVALADSPAELLATQVAFRRFMVGLQRRGQITVTQQGDGPDPVTESLRAAVRLGGPTIFNKTHPWRAEWSMSLFAPDSRRYSTTEHTADTTPYTAGSGFTFPISFPLTFGSLGTSGRIIAVNGGDISTGVKFSIAGACTNPQIVLAGTGQRLALIGAVDGDIEIDTDPTQRSVTRDGSPYAYLLSADSVFFQLPPGSSTLLFLVDSGTPTLTASWRDATP